MLWVAVHLPWLSLESFVATLPPGAAAQPLALEDTHRIVAANDAARRLGVEPGLKRATALALAPALTLAQADARRDAQALQAVAHAALAFTPAVAIQPAHLSADLSGNPSDASADTVLLEVRASLRLFGGLEPLLRRLRESLAPLGHALRIAVAPTALGAALLARAHRHAGAAPFIAASRERLHRALDAAPAALPDAACGQEETLQAMGLRTLGALRRLPRAGLARRFGAALLDELDRAYGDVPDPRMPLALPPSFDSRLELFARADSAEQVLHGAAILLERLIAWLAAQHAFVRRFALAMQHEPRWRRESAVPSQTVLDVALAEPSRDRAHLLVLLRERLARLALPAPTLELRLQAAAGDVARRAAPNAELFPTPRSEREGLLRLVERLQARLGRERVRCLSAFDDHRPELATVSRPADAGELVRPRRAAPHGPAAEALPLRPVWLADGAGEPLQERSALPWLDGHPLQLLAGPERIEAGWWDQHLVERDYFVAGLPGGALVWIYRTRPLVSKPTSRWFLQGRFG